MLITLRNKDDDSERVTSVCFILLIAGATERNRFIWSNRNPEISCQGFKESTDLADLVIVLLITRPPTTNYTVSLSYGNHEAPGDPSLL